jgi:hypothetical protein
VVTDKYGCLVLDNTSKSNKLEDCLFWYKAKFPSKNFKFGSKDMWKFHEQNFKGENYKEEEESKDFDRSKLKKKKENTINVKRVNKKGKSFKKTK